MKMLKIMALDIVGLVWEIEERSFTFFGRYLLLMSMIVSYYLWIVWFDLPWHPWFTVVCVLCSLPWTLYTAYWLKKGMSEWLESVKRRARGEIY